MRLAPLVLLISLFAIPPKSTARPCNPAGTSGRHLAQSSADGCKVLDGVDFPNNNPINDGNIDIVDTPEECCELCKSTPGCVTWVRIKVDTQWNKEGACWLKDEEPDQTECLACEGGLIPEDLRLPASTAVRSRPSTGATQRSAPVLPEECVILPGMDFPDGDIEPDDPPTVDSREECCDLCKMNQDCKSWTWTKTGKCFLKDEVTTPSICPKCDAGGFVESRVTAKELPLLEGMLTLVRDTTPDTGLKSTIDAFLGRAKDLNTGD